MPRYERYARLRSEIFTSVFGGTIDAAWAKCSPSSVREFSAVAYYFAREIYEREHVPIGVIESSWGGTVAEAWTSGG